MSHKLYEQKVLLNEDTHEYRDQQGDRYMGFSSFCDQFLLKPFNSAGAAYGVAKKAISEGQAMTASAVLDKWTEQRDLGVRYDKAIQKFLEEEQILPENEDISELIKDVCKDYPKGLTYCQSTVYNEFYKVAGATDIFSLTSKRPDAQIDLGDVKVFEREDNLYEHKGWFFPPLNHLSNTKITKINLQLTYYGIQLEELTGKRIRKLFVHLINPITKTHQKIILPYLKNDLLLLLETHKEKILEYSKKPEESLF